MMHTSHSASDGRSARLFAVIVRLSKLLVRRKMARALSATLIIVLVVTSTPAAPQVLTSLSPGWHALSRDILFYTSQWWSSLKAQLERKPEQEKQTERDERVVKIEIAPGDVTIETGEEVTFAATAYANDGQPIGGVRFKWLAEESGKGKSVRISRTGVFVSKVAGDFRVGVVGGERRAQVNVKVLGDTVNDSARRAEQPLSEKEVSTRDFLQPQSSSLKQQEQDERKNSSLRKKSGSGASFNHAPSAAAPAPIPIEGEWNDNNYRSADDPLNRRGDPPDQVSGDSPGSGNFQATAPVLELPGRGIDLQLRLTYNSALWNESGSEITYDIDHDWPAPGWSLGFGRLITMGSSGSMLVDADGTRHGFNGTMSNYSFGSSFTGHTTDSTFIDYTHTANASGVITSATARHSDGTIVAYGAPALNAVYPTRITDPNGNYITITYVNNQGPRIQNVTDTLGRLINFNYDVNGLLTAVTTPAMGISGWRTLVRLHYRQLTLGYSFSGLTPRVRTASPWVIDTIFYPATRTGYWFGDSDSYSSYGIISKVVEQRTMALYASTLTEQGTVIAGMMSNQKTYNYPMTSATQLSHAPTYTRMTEEWSGGDLIPPAATTFTVQQNTSPRTVTIVQPDGTRSVQYAYNYSSLPNTDPEKYKDGMTYQDETYDSTGKLLRRTAVSWERGAYDTLRPTRQETTDENGNITAEGFLYGAQYNQVTTHLTYGYGPWILRSEIVTEYENSPAYINRHIFNLVKSVTVYDRDEVTRVSRTDYQYDAPGSTLIATSGVVMHDESYDPYDPQYWVPENCYQVCNGYDPCYTQCDPGYWMSDYNASTDSRGNLTRVVKYADAVNLSGQVIETYGYDVTGNRVKTSSSCCELSTSNFTVDTQYAYSTSQSRGSSDPNSSIRVTSSSTFDFNTGLALTATDANGRTSQVSYLSDSLRPQTTTLSTGASTTFTYDDNGPSVTEAAVLANGTPLTTKIKRFDGRGLMIQEQSMANGVYDIVDMSYDDSGRLVSQTRPYRSGQPKYAANTFYDILGRITKVVAPEGSITENFYNETARPPVASTELGSTVRSVDAWGREHWERSDAAGNIVEVVEPNPNGTGSVLAAGGLVTRYTYDALGNLTEVLQGAQQRRFRYDSLGRLTHQKLAEAKATLNDAGQYVGNGQWSHVFTYDDRSNLIARVDPRGIRTVYNYNNDPLNRLQSVTYDTSGFGDTANPVTPAATITYTYMTSGDRMRPQLVTAQGVSTESYVYDIESRLTRKTLTLVSRPAFPMLIQYAYDTANRLTDVGYPMQYGTTFANKSAHYDLDSASRPTALQVNGAAYASQITYNASSQMLSMLVGASGANQLQETYAYDDKTGLISGQKVLRGTTALLDLTHFMYNTYARAGRTGQVSKILNNLNPSQSRYFTYDPLGRLAKVTNNSNWSETYGYDRYGNRQTINSSNSVAKLSPATTERHDETLAFQEQQRDSLPPLLRDNASNHVSDAPASPSPLSFPRRPANNVLLDTHDTGSTPAAPQQMPTPSPSTSPQPTPDAKQPADAKPEQGIKQPRQSIPATPELIICPPSDPSCGGNSPPTANPGGPYTGAPGQLIQFDGSNSYDDGLITTYNWTFGDGTTGTGVRPTHAYASPGAYTVTLRVRDNNAMYSPIVATGATISNPVYNGATFVSQTVPTTMNAGNTYTVTVTMKNSGTKTWTAADLHRLGPQNPQDNNTWGVSRVNVPSSVSPGKSATFTYTVTAPAASGTYNFQWRMLQENIEWFGDYTPNVAVTVAQTATGNCLSTNAPCDGIATLSYDVGSNRINTPGWLYDAAGNQTRAQRADGSWQRFQYDAAGRVVNVKTDAGVNFSSYTYGGNGERLVTQEGGDSSNQRIYYAWDGQNVVSEYVESSSSPTSPQWSKNYYFLGARLLATQYNGGIEYILFYHPDQLGTRLISNPLTGMISEQTTLPFGNAFAAESTGATNRRFTSYDRSASTGLDYAINRQYDPLQGRFTQADPIGMKAADRTNPQSLNLYAYCGNDPVNHIDPTGLLFGGLFKKIGKFFNSVWHIAKVIGRGISLVSTTIAKMLHNRWVMLGISILSLIIPPVWAIYQTVSEIKMAVETGWLLVHGRWKELGMALKAAIKQYVINKVAGWVLEKLVGAIYGIDIIKISPCIQQQLSKYFNLTKQVIGGMRLHIGHPGFSPPGTSIGGLTWGNDVYLFGVTKNNIGIANTIGLIGHESVHTLEVKVLGIHLFALSYGVGGIWSMFHFKAPTDRINPLERPAWDAEDRSGLNGDPSRLCPVTK